MADCMAATSARSASLDSLASTLRSSRACTARTACRRAVQPSNSAASASTRCSISRTLALLLPRRPRSSSSCSACERRRSDSRRVPAARSCPTAPSAACSSSSCWRGSSSAVMAASSAGRRLAASACASPPTRAASAWRADSGNTRCGGRPSVCAVVSRWRAICASTASGVASGSTSVSILFSTTKRSRLLPPRCSRQIARSDLVTPVSAASTNTVACADGSSDSVSSGSAPMAFRPGVSSTTRPRSSSGCG